MPALREHPGIGFVLVRSQATARSCSAAAAIHFLDEDRVEGDDPLAPFGAHAADHVRRADGFAHCPDLMVNSTYWDAADEVAAFEELVGSHGGMGGTQSYPFVLRCADLAWPDEDVVGAEAVHRVFRTLADRARPRRLRTELQRLAGLEHAAAPHRRRQLDDRGRRTRARARAPGRVAGARAAGDGERAPVDRDRDAWARATPPPAPRARGRGGRGRACVPQPATGSSATSRPPARSAIASNRSVSPAK